MLPDHILRKHARWREKLTHLSNPQHDWKLAPITLSHGDGGLGYGYQAFLHHPPDVVPADLITGRKRLGEPLRKAAQKDDCENGRWITVHPNGEEEEGHPVYICPNPDGSYTITRGAGGVLNGLRLSHVKSPEEYKRLGKERAAQERQQQRLQEEQRRHVLGVHEYERQQTEKQARQVEIEGAKHAAETEFLQAVAEAQGVDPSQFEVSPEATQGLPTETAERVQQRTHAAALQWAHSVVARTRDVVLSAYQDLSQDAIGDLAQSEIAALSHADTGVGYQAGLERMAQEHGLTGARVAQEQRQVALQRFLTSGSSLEGAREKQKGIASSVKKRVESNAQVRQAVSDIGEKHGQGPRAMEEMPTVPKAQSMEQAVAVLSAAQRLKELQAQAEAGKKELKSADDLRTLPKAAVVEAKESTPEEVLAAVADSLSQEAQQRAMTRLLNTANEFEAVKGTLTEHLSVGHAAALSALGQAVDGTMLDPLAVDILGPSGAAQVLAARWRASMPEEEYKAVAQALGAQHVATQEAIANEATQRAASLLDAAEALPELEPTDADSLAAALNVHAERASLLKQAREAAGVARGRLEAAAALNEALQKKSTGSIQVSLGDLSTKDALQQIYAIGLTRPSDYDEREHMTAKNQFTLSSDGHNRILEIHPEGLAALGGKADPGLLERARSSAEIKNGVQDDEQWLPAGISHRPATTFDADALTFRSLDSHLALENGMSEEDMQGALKRYIGQRISAGMDPFDVQSDIHSASFLAGLGLSSAAQTRFQDAALAVAPFKLLKEASSSKARAKHRQDFSAHRQALAEQLTRYADDYIQEEQAAGRLGAEDAALDRQRIPLDETAQDCAYQAALADPRTSFAFTPVGDLDRKGRDAVRAYAFEKLLGVDPSSEETITPMTTPERHAFTAWQELKGTTSNDPYQAIQDHMAANAPEDLFGDKEASPLAAVDLGNPLDVLSVGRAQASALGYEPIVGADGSKTYPFLEPGQAYQEVGEGGRLVTRDARTLETITSELRGKIRSKLREHFLADMVGLPEVAESGFNPDNVQTGSDRWGDFVKHMGGERRAIETVQEHMGSDLQQRFASHYKQRTGKTLSLGQKKLTHAQAFAEASLSPEEREAVTARKQARFAEVGRGERGKFVAGERREKVEMQEQAEQEGARLLGESESGRRNVATSRQTLGRAAEGALRSMMPYIDATKPLDVASNVSMGGKAINRQRAVKLILQNKRQGLNLAAGAGKTVVGIGAFTHARSEGKANKALYCVPSNIVGQFGGEFYKFVDPAAGMRWHADPSATAEERQAAYADPKTHACVVTPEALRGDITNAVAKDLGMEPNAAITHLSGLNEAQQDALIHKAMQTRGWNFDFSMFDEAHRLLGRQGKPDAHMARVSDSVGRMTPYFVHASADPVKNDASEVHSLLSKLDPTRYHNGNRAAFLRRYSRNTVAAKLALQRELEPYIYAASVDTGVTHERTLHTGSEMSLTPKQQKNYKAVQDAYQVARAARQTGDAEQLASALQVLSPDAFAQGMPAPEALARLSNSLGTLRDTALNRVVNLDPDGVKARWVEQHLSKNKGTPTLIFAHNLGAVKALQKRISAKGHKVGVLTGDMDSATKQKMTLAFSPQGGAEAGVDVLIASDCAAMGANMQRGSTLINYDTPMTSMLHEQRIAREVRTGQRNHVQVHDLVADAEYDQKARRRLERKKVLRDLLTTPAELIDDSGLAARLEKARAQAFDAAYK